jgi:hypothetical protein
MCSRGIVKQDFRVTVSAFDKEGSVDAGDSCVAGGDPGPKPGAAAPGPFPLGSPILPDGPDPVPSPIFGLLLVGAAPWSGRFVCAIEAPATVANADKATSLVSMRDMRILYVVVERAL